jgi:uncharacterized protein YggE
MNQDNKIKSYLYLAITIAVLVTAFSIFSFSQSYSSSITPSSFRSFSVTAEGKVTAIPDIARFSFSVITEGGKDLKMLQEENTKKTNEAISFLKENGVDSKDIKTSSYNISPRYQYYSCGFNASNGVNVCPPPEIVGYTINQTVSVKVRDFSKIGDIMQGVVRKGANNVSSLFFEIDEPEKLELEAKKIALKKAKEEAEEIAKTSGFSLGKILSISSSKYTPPPSNPIFFSKIMSSSQVEEKNVPPQIEAGSEEISVFVTVQYEIK